MDKIQEIKEMLDVYDHHYYNEDESLITDMEYDSLKKRYLTLTGKEEYDYVPGESTLGEKIKHKYPILSLKKTQSTDLGDIKKHIKELGYPVVVQPKFDGLTVVISNGKVATRGDGHIGEDITSNCLSIKGMKEILDTGRCFRGEALILKDDFNSINSKLRKEGKEEFKNSRNAASGMLRRKHSDPEGISVMLYDVLDHTGNMTGKMEFINKISKGDIYPSKTREIKTDTELEEFLNDLSDFDLNSFEYEIDGLVVRSNKHNSNEVFGYTRHHPKDSFAIKFPTESKWTRVIKITHQVGRTGKIVPVAEIEPIEIMDSTVSRVTLHNEAFMDSFGLSLLTDNSMVEVTKSNEIIPAIIDSRIKSDTVIQDARINKCPVCGSEVEKTKTEVFCKNDYCESKVRLRLKNMASRQALDIRGLSDSTVNKLFDSGLIKDPIEIFDLEVEDILKLEGFADKSANNLYEAIQEKVNKGVDFYRFLTSLSINMVGVGMSKEISKEFKTIDNLIEDVKDNGSKKLSNIKGVGDVVVESIQKNIDKIIMYADKIKVNEEKENNKPTKGNVCISGKFDMTKKEITKILEERGFNVIKNVTNDCDILLSKGTASSKYKKAVEKGIKIVDDLDNLK